MALPPLLPRSPHRPLFNPPPSCPPQVPHIREPLSSDHPRVSRHLLRVLRRLPRGPHTCTLFSGLSTEATGIQQKGSLPAGKNVIFVLRCVCCHGNNNREAIRQRCVSSQTSQSCKTGRFNQLLLSFSINRIISAALHESPMSPFHC